MFEFPAKIGLLKLQMCNDNKIWEWLIFFSREFPLYFEFLEKNVENTLTQNSNSSENSSLKDFHS